MTREQPTPERRHTPARYLDTFISIETSAYMEAPHLIEAFKESAKKSDEMLVGFHSQGDEWIQERQRLLKSIEKERISAIRDQGKKDVIITQLRADLESAKELTRDLERQASLSASVSLLATAAVAIGINIMTGDEYQEAGIAVTAIGILIQVATLFLVTKKRRRSSA